MSSRDSANIHVVLVIVVNPGQNHSELASTRQFAIFRGLLVGPRDLQPGIRHFKSNMGWINEDYIDSYDKLYQQSCGAMAMFDMAFMKGNSVALDAGVTRGDRISATRLIFLRF